MLPLLSRITGVKGHCPSGPEKLVKDGLSSIGADLINHTAAGRSEAVQIAAVHSGSIKVAGLILKNAGKGGISVRAAGETVKCRESLGLSRSCRNTDEEAKRAQYHRFC
jgi:hypothetical protein